MENKVEFSPEELEKALEKAKQEAQALLDKMTPQEREQAELKAKQLIEEDRVSMQKLVDEAASIAGGTSVNEKAPKFCTNCGASAGTGNFCTNCGEPLKN